MRKIPYFLVTLDLATKSACAVNSARKSTSFGQVAADGSAEISDGLVDSTPHLSPSFMRKLEVDSHGSIKTAADQSQITEVPLRSSELKAIHYGVFLKNFYGVSFEDGGWRGDIIVALSWLDANASQTLDGLTPKEAEAMIWMPDIVVTNLNFAAAVEISSTVKVAKPGTVITLSRYLVKLVAELDPAEFPFDSQVLKVRLASSKYMSDKVSLVPMTENVYSGVSEAAFGKVGGAWTLKSYSSAAVVETDGLLKKSRGEFILKVHRNWQTFLATLLLPELLVVLIPWTAFFFPLMPPFAMPKVASTMIPLLAMLGFMVRTANLMPSSSAWSWVYVYEEVCIQMLVFAIVGNMVIESTMYVFKNEELASKTRSETRMLYPVATAGCLLYVLSQRHTSEISILVWTTRIFWIFLMGFYFVRNAPASPIQPPVAEPLAAASSESPK